MTTMDEKRRPILGATVVTDDGQRLGAVKEIVGDCFKIDAPLQRDYWLGADTIADVVAGEMMLRVSSDDVTDVKLDSPEHLGVHRHAA